MLSFLAAVQDLRFFKLEIYLYREPFFGSRESCLHTYRQEIEDGLASLLWYNGNVGNMKF